MAWNHDDVAPNRSRDELLGDVIRRGERIRLRRRIVGGVGGVAAVLLVVAGVATVLGTGGEPATQLAAGGRSTTTVTTVAVTGRTVFAVDAPSTSVDASTPTTRVPVAATVDAPVTTVATTVPPATTPEPTVPAPKQPRCGPAVMQVTITMASTFAVGQPVTGQAVLHNTTGAPCYAYSFMESQEITDLAGNPVVPSSALIADDFEDTPYPADKTLTAPINWDTAPAGTYRVKASWSFDGPPVEATFTFTVA